MNINLRSMRVAFAVNNNNEFEEKHFGEAGKYMIYQWHGEQFLYQTELINQSKDLDESSIHGSKLKGNSIISILKDKDVNVLVSKQFGKNIKMVNKHFIPVIIKANNINKACELLAENLDSLVEYQQKDSERYKLFDLRSGSLKEKIKDQYNENQ